MDQFLISPDDCLILRALKSTASLREAAKLLNCDPAGLQRKTIRISEEYGYLQKIKGHWTLTDAGKVLVGWLEESIIAQKKILSGDSRIRIAATTWMIEQLLIPNSTALLKALGTKSQLQYSTPLDFETHLIEGSCDYVVVCHPPEDPAIAHRQLFKEEWVAVIPASWGLKKAKISDLLNRPFIRHEQINPDIFKVATVTLMTTDNLISVRSAVQHGLGWSIVPKILVNDLIKRKEIIALQEEIPMDRKLCVWWLRRRLESKKMASLLCNFIQNL